MNGGTLRKATLSASYPTLETDIFLGPATTLAAMEEMADFIH